MNQHAHSPRLLRDFDGYVHTPRGFIAKRRYIALRNAQPELRLPKWEDVPLMSELSDADLERWYRGERVTLRRDQLDEHDAHALARFEDEGGALGATQ